MLRQRWTAFIEPHHSIVEPVQRQTARNLAALSLFFAILTIPAAPVLIISFGTNLLVVLVLLVLDYLFVYWLSRGRHPLVGSMLLIFGFALGILATILAQTSPLWESVLVWLIVPIILSGILLPLCFAVMSSVIIFALALITSTMFPVSAAVATANSLFVIFFGAVVVHFTQYLREDAIKRLEQRNNQLAESERRYATLFDDVPIGQFAIARGGTVTNANRATVEILGFPDRQTLLDTPVDKLFVDIRDFQQWQSNPPSEPTTYNLELQLRTYDARLIWAKVNMKAEFSVDGPIYQGSIEDISERKQAEIYEVEQRRLAEVLRDTAMAVTLSLDLDAVLDLVSMNLEQIVKHNIFNLMLVEGDAAFDRSSQGLRSI